MNVHVHMYVCAYCYNIRTYAFPQIDKFEQLTASHSCIHFAGNQLVTWFVDVHWVWLNSASNYWLNRISLAAWKNSCTESKLLLCRTRDRKFIGTVVTRPAAKRVGKLVCRQIDLSSSTAIRTAIYTEFSIYLKICYDIVSQLY